MPLGSRPEGPVEVAVGVVDGDVIDARFASAHEPGFVELPLLVAVRPFPGAG